MTSLGDILITICLCFLPLILLIVLDVWATGIRRIKSKREKGYYWIKFDNSREPKLRYWNGEYFERFSNDSVRGKIAEISRKITYKE